MVCSDLSDLKRNNAGACRFCLLFYRKGDKLSKLLSAKIIIFGTFKCVFLNMIELIFLQDSTFERRLKNNSWLAHVQEIFFKIEP